MKKELFEIVSEEDESKVLQEALGLEPEKLQNYMELFSQWISSQKNLPQGFGQACKKKFLIWAKLDLEKAKGKFVKYCYNSLTHKEFVANRRMEYEGDFKATKYMYIAPMPKLSPEKYHIIVYKAFDAEQYDVLELCRYIAITSDYYLHCVNLHIGYILVFDAEPLKVHHYARVFTITYLKFLKFTLNNFPLKIKRVLLLKMHPLLEKGVNLCLSVVPDKFKKRTAILGSYEDLHQYIPPECLPSDYGGSQKSLKQLSSDWSQYLMENKDTLLEISSHQAIGPIPKEINVDEDEFGVHGSFRKLNVD